MVVYGDTAEYIARLGLQALARRLGAAHERERQQLHQMATILATVTNAPHYRPKKPLKADDLTGRRRAPDRDGFEERERAYYRLRVDKLLSMRWYDAHQYMTSRRGQERRRLREAVDERRQGSDSPLLYKMHRTLLGDTSPEVDA